MCFDSICNDSNIIHGATVICVVQGYFLVNRFTCSHELAVTTVQVKLEETERGTRMPVGIEHVDIAVSSVEHKGWILTNYAFAVQAYMQL